MLSAIDQLAAFIAEVGNRHTANRWLSDDRIDVYVRKGRHMIDGRLAVCLDVANVEVAVPGTGVFSRWFLPAAVRLNPWDYVFAENVLGRRLANWFVRNEWHPVPYSNPPCFYLPKSPPVG